MVEPSKDPILFRCSKLKHTFTGKLSTTVKHQNLVTLEGLLDAFFLLYDECNSEQLHDQDKFMDEFVKKFRNSVTELKGLRVNIGDFEVHKIIGRGHFGEVQVVREKQTGEVHAMKILRKKETLAQENMAFYEEERDIMATAHSPWITQLHYAFQDHSNLYLVMEFHPGGDLLSLMDRQDTLSEEETRFYLAEMTLAIQALHQMGYVHRDIKPDNILIDRLGHIKLADFGSAAKLNSSGKVESKMPVGTPDYLAPEVLSGMNSSEMKTSYGIECDWWSLGIVGYELLCGNSPFADEKSTVTYNNIMNYKKTFQWPLDSDFTDDMKDVIKNLLEESTERFGFHELYKHKLFVSINWNDIRNTIPPFVPKVTAQDDTSNFDRFERVANKPNFDDYKLKRGFSGRNLPFVGFTFTNNIALQQEENCERKLISNRSRRSGKLELEVENKKTEAEEALRRVSNLEESERQAKSKITHLQKLLEVKEDELKTVKHERDINENDLSKCLKEITKMKRFLEFERNERLLNEKKALQLISDAKEKWKREEDCLKTELQKRESYVASVEPKIFESQSKELKYQKLVETMEKELKEAKVMMGQYKKKVEKMMENKKERVSEVHGMLEEISTEKEAKIEKLEKQVNEMALKKQNLQERVLKTEKMLQQKEELLIFMEKERECLASCESEYEEKLKSAQEKCLLLEEKLSDYENNSNEYSTKEYEFQELQKNLAEEREATRLMQEKLELLEKSINSTISTQSNAFTKIQVEMSNEIQGLAHEKKEVDNIKLKLESDLQTAQEKQKELYQQIEELKSVITNLEKTSTETNKQAKIHAGGDTQIMSTENGVQNRDSESKVQISKLQSQLELARDVSSSERKRVRELQDELRKVQKENSDVKLDLRISQRELKKAQEEITVLENSIKTLESNCSEVQNRAMEMKEKENELSDKVKNLEVELCVKKQELERYVERSETEKSKLEKRMLELEEANKDKSSLENRVDKLQYQNEELCKQKAMLEGQIKLMEELKQQHKLDEGSVRSELETITTKYKKVENNLNLLKSTCVVLEGQLKDFEILVENHEVQEETLLNEKMSLDKELNNLEKQLESTKLLLAQEKSLKESVERERDQLQNKLDTVKAVQAAEANTLKGELYEQKAAVIQYNDELNDTEQKLISAERARKNFQQRSEMYERESTKIKEEAAALITQVNSLRDSNLKLTLGLGEAIEKCEYTKDRVSDLESALESEHMAHQMEKVRLQATIDQQSKLINFLQSQNEGKKKKTLQEKLFGRSLKPTSSKIWTEKEKQATIIRAKQEYNSPNDPKPPTPNTKAILPVITQSPGDQYESPDGLNQNLAEERMRHNIPHRFQNYLNLRATKCATCLYTIHFGRRSVKCQECHMTVHQKCAPSLPRTCGLPTGFYQHFRKSLRSSRSSRSSRSLQKLNSNGQIVKGIIKVPKANKPGWEEKFAIIDGSKLNMYDSESKSNDLPVDSCDLCPEDGETVIHGAVSPSELISTAKSDLPYILKIEMIPQTTCWPGKTMYLLTKNFDEKQRWVFGLEKAVKEHTAKSKKVKEAKLLGSVVLRAQGENFLDVNCLIHLNSNLVLIGAEEGLFYMEIKENKANKKAQKIVGVESVFQLEFLRHLNCLIMIANRDRELCQISLPKIHDAIQNKSEIEPDSIENLNSCHLFAHGISNQTTYICAATVEKISLCKYGDSQMAFCLQKAFMTGEPCSCIHFTKNSIIVGADKFFEIDLKNLTVEEFLDASDSSLSHAVFATAQINSFPVAILQVSEPGAAEEYLLCFHEFGVFVDGYGIRSRKGDLLWTRLPLSFAYRPPYLFITHFNSIEITEIKSLPDKGKGKNIFLEVTNPRYLNRHPSKIGCIYLASIYDECLDIFCLQGNIAITNSNLEADRISEVESSDTETVCTSSSSSEFSFSSSIMNIIEGSEAESSDYSHIASTLNTPRNN